MSTRLIIEGNSVYEIDEDCLACSEKLEKEKKEPVKRPGERIGTEDSAGPLTTPAPGRVLRSQRNSCSSYGSMVKYL